MSPALDAALVSLANMLWWCALFCTVAYFVRDNK